jgi:hypothetical protein
MAKKQTAVEQSNQLMQDATALLHKKVGPTQRMIADIALILAHSPKSKELWTGPFTKSVPTDAPAFWVAVGLVHGSRPGFKLPSPRALANLLLKLSAEQKATAAGK